MLALTKPFPTAASVLVAFSISEDDKKVLLHDLMVSGEGEIAKRIRRVQEQAAVRTCQPLQ